MRRFFHVPDIPTALRRFSLGLILHWGASVCMMRRSWNVGTFCVSFWMKQLGGNSIPDLGNSLSPKIVELCAGTGAMSMGAKYLGADPILAVDWNPKAVDLLSANHPGTTLQLDLTSSDAARQIHAACEGRPGTIFNKASSWAVVTHVLKCYGMACTSPSCSKHNPSFWSARPWPGTTSRSRTA